MRLSWTPGEYGRHSASLSNGKRTLWLHAYPTGSWVITGDGDVVKESFDFCTGRLDKSRVKRGGLEEAMLDAAEEALEILGTAPLFAPRLQEPGEPLTSQPEA